MTSSTSERLGEFVFLRKPGVCVPFVDGNGKAIEK